MKKGKCKVCRNKFLNPASLQEMSEFHKEILTPVFIYFILKLDLSQTFLMKCDKIRQNIFASENRKIVPIFYWFDFQQQKDKLHNEPLVLQYHDTLPHKIRNHNDF